MEKGPIRSDAYFPEWKPAFKSLIPRPLFLGDREMRKNAKKFARNEFTHAQQEKN